MSFTGKCYQSPGRGERTTSSALEISVLSVPQNGKPEPSTMHYVLLESMYVCMCLNVFGCFVLRLRLSGNKRGIVWLESYNVRYVLGWCMYKCSFRLDALSSLKK